MAPESPVPASSAAGFGYAEGKWVAESVCQRISEATGLVSSIVRVGQLSGDSDGRWNVKEWVPALIKIGKAIGSLPSRDEVNFSGVCLGHTADSYSSVRVMASC